MSKLSDGLNRRWDYTKASCRDFKPLWWWVLIAAFLFVAPYDFQKLFGVAGELADRIRWSGMFFQFVGLVTVVIGLNESRKLFERPPIFAAVLGMLARLRYIVIPPKHISGAVGVIEGADAADAVGAVVTKARTNNLEDRVANLEVELNRIDSDVQNARRDIGQLKTHVGELIADERNQRQVEDIKISKQLETATIGGITLELSGLAYLLLGILLTTIPQEIALLLQTL